MRRIIEATVDAGSFFETGRQWGRGIITGFARIDGYSVAVLAGDPMFLAGAWTSDVCRKVIKHVDLAQTFHLPVVHFVDCPGFAVGVKHERSGVVKLGVQAMAAVYQAKVPWCSIVVRQAFGLAGSAMMNPTRLKYRYCWPSGDWGSLPMEGGIEAAYKSDIEAHPEPEKRLKEIRAWAEALRISCTNPAQSGRSSGTGWPLEHSRPGSSSRLEVSDRATAAFCTASHPP